MPKENTYKNKTATMSVLPLPLIVVAVAVSLGFSCAAEIVSSESFDIAGAMGPVAVGHAERNMPL